MHDISHSVRNRLIDAFLILYPALSPHFYICTPSFYETHPQTKQAQCPQADYMYTFMKFIHKRNRLNVLKLIICTHSWNSQCPALGHLPYISRSHLNSWMRSHYKWTFQNPGPWLHSKGHSIRTITFLMLDMCGWASSPSILSNMMKLNILAFRHGHNIDNDHFKCEIQSLWK